MKTMKILSAAGIACAALVFLQGCEEMAGKTKTDTAVTDSTKSYSYYSRTDTNELKVSDGKWRDVLPPNVYAIARDKGTEVPWSSKYARSRDTGTYYCAACGNALFRSTSKFDSGCGWPSFTEPVRKNSVLYLPDNSDGMQRTEIQCGRCKSHLGHVFNDGPPPTGLRYCINGVVLDFDKKM